MTLYARSDVMSVVVPAENGGCGNTHTRPVNAGVPSATFKLDCLPCESFLKKDIIASNYRKTRLGNGSREDLKDRWPGLWGHTDTAIPETPGEEEAREWGESQAAKDAAKAQLEQAATTSQSMDAMAQAIMSNNQLMAMLAQHFAGTPAAAPPQPELMPPTTLVHDGYNSRACEDCGADIIRPEGQKGALAHRCPACKAKRRNEQNKAWADRQKVKAG